MNISILLFIFFLTSCGNGMETISITPKVQNEEVMISIRIPNEVKGTVTLYRSTRDFSHMRTISLSGDPVVKWEVPADTVIQIRDSSVPHGTELFYYSIVYHNGKAVAISPVKRVTTSPVTLPESASKVILVVDKVNYTLSVVEKESVLKRYPINLGSLPKNRKLHWDNRSTPEGVYKVNYFNENSSFHRSMGVNYPNSEDRKRYAEAKNNGTIPLKEGKPVSIGGSITIHGGGVWNNWTFGCIALNNSDVDELMDWGSIRVGTPIIIGGGELSLDSLLNN